MEKKNTKAAFSPSTMLSRSLVPIPTHLGSPEASSRSPMKAGDSGASLSNPRQPGSSTYLIARRPGANRLEPTG